MSQNQFTDYFGSGQENGQQTPVTKEFAPQPRQREPGVTQPIPSVSASQPVAHYSAQSVQSPPSTVVKAPTIGPVQLNEEEYSTPKKNLRKEPVIARREISTSAFLDRRPGKMVISKKAIWVTSLVLIAITVLAALFGTQANGISDTVTKAQIGINNGTVSETPVSLTGYGIAFPMVGVNKAYVMAMLIVIKNGQDPRNPLILNLGLYEPTSKISGYEVEVKNGVAGDRQDDIVIDFPKDRQVVVFMNKFDAKAGKDPSAADFPEATSKECESILIVLKETCYVAPQG